MQILFSWMSLCSSKHQTISNHYLKVAICTLLTQVITWEMHSAGAFEMGCSGAGAAERSLFLLQNTVYSGLMHEVPKISTNCSREERGVGHGATAEGQGPVATAEVCLDFLASRTQVVFRL